VRLDINSTIVVLNDNGFSVFSIPYIHFTKRFQFSIFSFQLSIFTYPILDISIFKF